MSVSLIPIMTSNTTPEGICNWSDASWTGVFKPYNLFDNVDTTDIVYNYIDLKKTSVWVQYQFAKEVTIEQITLKYGFFSLATTTGNVKFSYSLDGITFIDFDSNGTDLSGNSDTKKQDYTWTFAKTKVKYIRLTLTQKLNSQYSIDIYGLTCLGYKDIPSEYIRQNVYNIIRNAVTNNIATYNQE